MKRWILCWLAGSCAAFAIAAESPSGAGAGDPLRGIGCLDVTKAPYAADSTGTADATHAIQRAVNDARDHGLVCFFPGGTYRISDTISCEQKVSKLTKPRHVDGGTQHYWPVHRPMILMGSTKGQRPVLKLSTTAKGFDNPSKPKIAIWIWAQTWSDAPGKEEPVWGKEQSNISFNHVFKGIDLDIRGHAGAIGIRHSGSQGSTLQDCRIYADGAYAGMNNCCGQGGGTYNVDVIGGRYGIVIEPSSRFPILTACEFKGQTKAAIRYARGGSQVPTLLVGCRLQPAGDVAVDCTTERSYAGISMVDCLIELGRSGVVCRTRRSENIFLEQTYVRGARSVYTRGPKIPAPQQWTRIERYSSHTNRGVNLVNGALRSGEIVVWNTAEREPVFETIRRRHYSGTPSFEDKDAVNVKRFGAKGDGRTDDTKAFEKAIAASETIFVPKGDYRLSGTLRMAPKTHLFGLSRTLCSIGNAGSGRGRRPRGGEGDSFSLMTADRADAAPGLTFLSVRGRVQWRSGQGTWMLASGSLAASGNAGGRLYGVMAMRRPFVLKGIRHPMAFYALNVERVVTNPQSAIQECAHIRVYYFKVESGTIQRPNAGDANTPCRIANSRDVNVYCMYGNVRKLVDRPMLEVIDSTGIAVSQLKAFRPGPFPHVREMKGQVKIEVPSSKICALFVRDK